jgi:hypothetical protein
LRLIRCCGVLLLLGSTAAAAAGLQVVTVDQQVLLALDLAREPCWVMRWNHSVTGILVDDYYCLQQGRMVLTASHTPAFDAGLGHIPGRGRLESDARHGYWIREINEPVPGNGYWLRVGGPKVNHRIVHAGREHSLSERAADRRLWLRIVPETKRHAENH